MSRRRLVATTLGLTALVVTGTGIAWAYGVTLTSQKLGASAVTTPVMFPVSVTLTNKGPTTGKIESGDTLTLVWSQLIDSSSLCSGWTGTTTPATLTLAWSVMDNGAANDTLVPTGSSPTCVGGLHAGSIDLGAVGYNTKTGSAMVFGGTTNQLSYSGTTTTLLVTLKNPSGGTAGTVTAATGSAATWTCDAALTDRATPARTCGSNVAKSTTTVQF